ncbi:hypothetical protein NK6_9370 [Bradyrhizobium diazoefficiens]|uniref:Uncharacterized protein n=1 Tax=Bradyrhizobium diazoefficiens TaxID=1355477 RepID=A0A0E4G134_9BRAD|nr:hypothetical protein NK6_9370 [Bradyrhizobium diazoefficiens]
MSHVNHQSIVVDIDSNNLQLRSHGENLYRKAKWAKDEDNEAAN